MLTDLIRQGYGKDNLSCAERILYGANEAYGLGLDSEALKLATGFGGGMAIESICGVLTGGVMCLGKLFGVEKAQEGDKIKEVTREFFTKFGNEMGGLVCTQLKGKYRTETEKCQYVILKAAEILDAIVLREKGLGK